MPPRVYRPAKRQELPQNALVMREEATAVAMLDVDAAA